MWMQFNVMPWTSLGVDAVYRHAQDEYSEQQQQPYYQLVDLLV